MNDVSSSTNTVVVASPSANTDVFSHSDLYVIDVVVVPERLIELVGKSERKNVLNSFLAQVVIDAKD